MSIDFNPVLPWPAVVMIAAAMAYVVLVVYRRRLAGQPDTARLAMMTLRTTMLLLLILAMLRPSVEWTEPDDRPWQIAVLADASRSMSVEDRDDGVTRRAVAAELLRAAKERLDGEEQVSLSIYDFDETVRPVEEEFSEDADGDWTDLAAGVESVRERARSDRILAAVVLSDGAVRTPDPTAGAASTAAELLASETGASLNPVRIGTADLSTRGVDLAVEDILIDRVGFVKKTMPVRARVRLSGYVDRPATVRVLIEDRAGRQVGEAGEFRVPEAGRDVMPVREVSADSGSVVVPVDLSFTPETQGDLKVRVEVIPDGDEIRTANNARETLITVRENGLRVAYFDTARWDQKFIRRVNRTDRIQLDYVFIPDATSLETALREGEWFEPNRYDVFLIGDLPAEVLGQRSDFADRLVTAVRRGAGLGILAGGDLLSRPPPESLSSVLPATWESVVPRTREDGFRFVPTPRGLGHYVLRVGQPDVWDELPPFERVFPVEPRNETVLVLAETLEGTPLILAADTGNSRTAVLASADTWMWYTAGFADVHQRFWQQMLLWLGRKELDSQRQTFIAAEPRVVDRGQRVALSFGARDGEGTPREDVTFEMEVVGPEGESVEVPIPAGATNAEFVTTGEAGDYWATLTATDGDGNALPPATTRFLVNATDPELDNPAADFGLLEDLAAVTGGVSLAPDEFDGWLDELIVSGKENEVVKTSVFALWDGWPLLLAFVILLFVDWGVRRYRGLI